ncbi:MAG: tetratricopeptide repeat protein [Armatimonadota bacterium]
MKVKTAAILIVFAAMGWIGAQPAWAPDAFSSGLALFNAGEWTRAASQLVAAASIQPNDVVVRLTAGVALANIKRYPEAAEQFKAAALIEPDGILPHLLLDGVYAEMGNQAESRRSREEVRRLISEGRAFGLPTSSDQALLRSLEKYPHNAIARLLLGDLYQLQGNLGPARAQYEKASQLSPKWAKPVFNLGMADLKVNPQQAEKRFSQAIRMDPANKRTYLWLGDALLEQNRTSKAIEAYNQAAKDKGLAAEAQTRIGNAQLRARNFLPAREAFARAAKYAPHDPRPIAGQAQVFQSEGKLKQAEEKYSQAAEVLAKNRAPASSQAIVQTQLGTVQAEQGKVEDAIANLKRAFELHPTRSNAETLVAAQQKAGRLAEAVAETEAILERDSTNVPSMIYLLSAYRATGSQLRRIDIANRLIKADPANASTYYAELGAAYVAAGNIADGIEAYVRAFETGGPTTWEDTARSAASAGVLGQVKDRVDNAFKASGKERTGVILFEIQSVRKDAQGMIAAAEALTELNPNQPTHWLRLGQAYEQAGNKNLALAAYSKAASGSDPDAAAAARARMESIAK